MPVNPELRWYKEEDHKFEVSLSYTARPSLQKPKAEDVAQW
jgi:hypothetical protein